MNELISIIVRTKNEERWIAQCLRSVFEQKYKEFEVILVDNESTDKTIEKARQFKIGSFVQCKDYLPGKALNMGIKEARGKYIVCLSGHCIPVNDEWLSNLIRNFSQSDIAGVYGRQEPMAFSSDADKRDLALIFGLDRKIQVKDSFFHNANSMIRKDVLDSVPFDATVTNIEDRVWAKEVLQKGYRIMYEPEASVYHYHGIHQNGNVERCANVVRILERLHRDYEYKSIDIEKMNIVALIPMRGKAQYLDGKPLLKYTIDRAFKSKYIKRTIVCTDSAETAALAKDLDAEAPFLRDSALSDAHVDITKVLKYSLYKLEELKVFPDLVVYLEVTFPFRPQGLIDDMIDQVTQNGLDSVVAARLENKAIWREEDGNIVQLIEGLTPRQFKEPAYIELRGVGCVTHPEIIRQDAILGKNVGIFEIENSYSHLEVRGEEDFKMATILIKELF